MFDTAWGAKARADSLSSVAEREIAEHFHGKLQCVDRERACVLYVIPFGSRGWVAVFGDPDNASYEWIGRVDEGFNPPTNSRPTFRHSDDGYGSAAPAMRDGLVQMLEEF